MCIRDRDKSREVFDRNKILKGMLRACEKRSVTINELETAISEIEATLQSLSLIHIWFTSG